MLETNKTRVLNIIKRYFGIEGDDAEALLQQLDTVHVAGGEWVMRQGEDADALYFLVRGRLQGWADPVKDRDNSSAILLGEIAPGESVGEVGLLTGEPRSASIQAIRDSLLLKLNREVFARFSVEHPELIFQLAGGVAKRLSAQASLAPVGSRQLTTVALVPLQNWPWLERFTARLEEELSKRGPTICLTSKNLAQCGAPMDAQMGDEEIPTDVRYWLDEQENNHFMVVYVSDADDSPWSRLCVRQSDIVLLLADAASTPDIRPWESRLLESPGKSMCRSALLLRQSERNAPIKGTLSWLKDRKLDFHLHLRPGHGEEINRLARMLTGEAVGLVLGSGVARGFAEIGAYRALVEAGVPVDWVGGTSIGAVVGAAIAHDRGPQYVTEVSREAFVKGKPFSDYTLPLLSIIRGKRMERLTNEKLRGNIEDLPIPFFCVSSCLDDGEVHVHETGVLGKAVRASAAMPGFLPPTVIDHRLLVDGAVLNSIPIDIMQSKMVGRIIAVDVSSRRDLTIDYSEIPSPWAMLLGRISPFGKKLKAPDIISVIMKSTEIGVLSRRPELREHADLMLSPPVSGFGMTDVTQFDRIVQTGYDYTREKLAEWLSHESASKDRSANTSQNSTSNNSTENNIADNNADYVPQKVL